MADILETIIADTSYEAERLAKERFGNNFEIVNTETVKDSIYWGWGKHERIKITIKLNGNSTNAPINNLSYSTISAPTDDNNKYNHTGLHSNPKTTIPRISVYTNDAKKRYVSAQSKMRTEVDGLHGIQEDDEEPKSEKNINNDYSLLANDLLDSLKGIQNKRKIENKIGGELKNNTINSRKLEEIQNQIDKLTTTITNLVNSSNNFLNANQLPQGLSEIEKELQEIETPQEIIKEIFKSLKQSCNNRILCESKASFSALHNLMKKRLMISSGYEIKKTANPQVIILMGPTGVGKTTTIAKLAAQFCLNPEKQIKVCFFNIDFYKLGAKEQLQKYADIFRIALEDITTIESLDKCLAKHQNDDLIIVDTAGRSQYAYQDLDELKSYLNRIPNATRYLTMSSTSKYSDLKEIVSSFGHIGFDHIILTKTDETKTIGPAMGILLKANKSLAYITNGQQVPEDYSPADFGFFEEKLFHAIRYNNPRQVL